MSCEKNEEVLQTVVVHVPTVTNQAPSPINWMVPAIISCLCCFPPTGIFAIVMAKKANTAAATGNISEANVLASRARILVIVSVVLGTLLIVLGVIYNVFLIRFVMGSPR